ncbi:hypothetical protein ABTY59_37425 [Streptomyces sp. NPDC096079]|uniref:hypothetical protein n=1 Tax=Streptomyces sp. NPDC096079 TaxID=3155820 RepID=UPI0033260978
MSLNDALRVLIRRGARPLPRTLAGLDERIADHPAECDWCPDIWCPESMRMAHARRILTRTPDPSPAPPPAPEALSGVVWAAPQAPEPKTPEPDPEPPYNPLLPPWRQGFKS